MFLRVRYTYLALLKSSTLKFLARIWFDSLNDFSYVGFYFFIYIMLYLAKALPSHYIIITPIYLSNIKYWMIICFTWELFLYFFIRVTSTYYTVVFLCKVLLHVNLLFRRWIMWITRISIDLVYIVVPKFFKPFLLNYTYITNPSVRLPALKLLN